MALFPPPITANSGAGVIARMLRARGVDRVFGLCGGHIMPMWMRLDAEGVRIVDVRDERAAVYMAHAHAELTGEMGVALVTAGPGVTNAMTGIANAHVASASVLVLSGLPPRPQENRGALQDMTHTDFVKPLTRYARTVREASLIPQELDEAIARAFGQGGEPGPVYLDFRSTRCERRSPGRCSWKSTSRQAASAHLPRSRGRAARSRSAVVGASRAGDQRARCARVRLSARASARPLGRAIS